ncbi:putative alpha-galactosidase B [Trichodelitschia bisporula]|uniref:Alpha-galactosidase n=1 Tax=Trichodelitschia bisporula TaxID=703511 RepID=A0A6G1HJB2_9PEZI|nr:putative alpha-galactosidase B [Trichodelitschia bisporula]
MVNVRILVPLAAAVGTSSALVRPSGVGRLPALGWNSWNSFHCDIDENKFLTAAQKLVDLGLKDAGYEYVNIDDCWSESSRDASTGRLRPNMTRFPDGIKGTADKIHAMNLKIGIYSSAGTQTCAGYPASLGQESTDAKTWADWGIDYLKYDNCNVPDQWRDECVFCLADDKSHSGSNGTCTDNQNYCPSGYDYSKSKTAERYRRMRDAIDAQSRPMLYSLCEWGTANVGTWGASVAASWRSTGDIFNNWGRIKEILNENSFQMNHVDFWAHSDADMLEVGNGISVAEGRSHFALWAAMKSPLLIGADLTQIPSADVDTMKNKYLLAFNQDDVHGKPATPYKWGTNPNWTWDADRPAEYWSGTFKQGTMVLVLNTDESTATRNIAWGDIPGLSGDKSYQVTDAWTDTDLGCVGGGMDVVISAHDTAVFVLKGECSSPKRRVARTFRVGIPDVVLPGKAGLARRTPKWRRWTTPEVR